MNAGANFYIVGRGIPHPDTKPDLYDPTHMLFHKKRLYLVCIAVESKHSSDLSVLLVYVCLCTWYIRESVDSLCRDGADTPRPPYIGNACTRPYATFVSLFSRLTVVLKCFCTKKHSQSN